jgi:imidazole glycerol phosphate synthase subunit HisF
MIKRIGAVVILDSNLVVNAYQFTKHLPVGSLKFTIQRLQELRVDEIIILNSSHSESPDSDFKQIFADFDSWHISTPIAYGGGIISRVQAINIIKSGADRIVISAKVLAHDAALAELGGVLGEQAIILHLPIIAHGYEFRVLGLEKFPLDSIIAKIPQNWGGEVMISIVEHDGARIPNWEIIQACLQQLGEARRSILCSGFTLPKDISNALNIKAVQAVGIGNFLHRTEISISLIKNCIRDQVQIR